ncbi:energy transducer TonB [Parasphingopyxis sp.]|uniref:energy transducer TonB n=1 Tax=Parasphingopyxis sp. TaxID=1920299 RepID=UPI0034579941
MLITVSLIAIAQADTVHSQDSKPEQHVQEGISVNTRNISPVPPPPSSARFPRPSENPNRWITNRDYPAESIRAGESGRVSYRLTIGENGRVSGCDITQSSGYTRLDEATCQLISERGRFQPALDADGVPTEGPYGASMTWTLP